MIAPTITIPVATKPIVQRLRMSEEYHQPSKLSSLALRIRN